MTLFDELASRFESPPAREFYGEQVTIASHMCQAAALAEADGASAEMIVAALLHDVGHLVPDLRPDDRNRDHARLAMEILGKHLGPEVTEPVRLHVDAKRYLVAVDPSYAGTLSPASVHTLKLQGGPMTESESRAFATHKFFDDAVKLRRWDEAAKDPSAPVFRLSHFKPYIDSVAVLDPNLSDPNLHDPT